MSKEVINVENIVAPPRVQFHIGYVFFYALTVVAALWQHGNPYLTITVLALVLPIGLLGYVSYKKVDAEKRFWMQIFIACAAITWTYIKFHQKVEVDKAMVEGLCIVGLCFLFAQRREDYDYLLLIGLFLLLYGALLPRPAYLISIVIGGVLGLFLMYSSRGKALSGNATTGRAKGVFKRNFMHIIMHLGLVCFIFWYLFSIMPRSNDVGEGLIEVSFDTDRDFMHKSMTSWFKPKKYKKSSKGQYQVNTGKPNTLGNKGVKVAVKNANAMSSSGQGGGPPGKEIIFRAKSPVKLYWLIQLFDQYDGTTWKASKYITDMRLNRKKLEKIDRLSTNVEQRIIIENWISKKLPAAFRASSFVSVDNTSDSIFYLTRTNAYQGEIRSTRKDTLPATPYRYDVSSIVYMPVRNKDTYIGSRSRNYWLELTPVKNYLALPKDKIPSRVKTLALHITRNIKDPYQKAIVLRDYLRNNYKYKQFSQRPPLNREASDFFLFELREGHCEYFASALAVLARYAGLPARIATGFSPGDFNALTGYFEVKEYHAHAWTQIFINGMGWLTFDASPPGNVTSRTTPFGLGLLRDPFGDEWRISPPELTEHTQKVIKEQILSGYEKQGLDVDSATARLLQAMAGDDDELNKTGNVKEEVPKGTFERLIYNFKANVKSFFANIKNSIKTFLASLKQHTVLIMILLIMVAALYTELAILKMYFKKRLLLRKSDRLFKEASKALKDDSELAITLCYKTVRELLILVNCPREKNMDLFDYGAALNSLDHVLCNNVLVVYFFYSRMEYSLQTPGREDAAMVFERTARIRSFIMNHINEEVS